MYEQKETSQHRKQKLQTKRNTHIYISQYIYIYRERERGINVRDTIFSQLLT